VVTGDGASHTTVCEGHAIWTEFYDRFNQEWMFDIWGPMKLLPE